MARRRYLTKPFRGWKSKQIEVVVQGKSHGVEAVYESKCDGLAIYRAVGLASWQLPYFNIAHVRSGENVVNDLRTQKIAKEAVKELCEAANRCGISWGEDGDAIRSNSCLVRATLDIGERYPRRLK
jgi:hypothetical protein